MKKEKLIPGDIFYFETENEKNVYLWWGTTIPSFYADIKSMLRWEEPFQNLKVTDEDKEAIINFITNESKIRGIKVIFDWKMKDKIVELLSDILLYNNDSDNLIKGYLELVKSNQIELLYKNIAGYLAHGDTNKFTYEKLSKVLDILEEKL